MEFLIAISAYLLIGFFASVLLKVLSAFLISRCDASVDVEVDSVFATWVLFVWPIMVPGYLIALFVRGVCRLLEKTRIFD